jgi:uncharacterized membrane protein YagU involved in acid resistance
MKDDGMVLPGREKNMNDTKNPNVHLRALGFGRCAGHTLRGMDGIEISKTVNLVREIPAAK